MYIYDLFIHGICSLHLIILFPILELGGLVVVTSRVICLPNGKFCLFVSG